MTIRIVDVTDNGRDLLDLTTTPRTFTGVSLPDGTKGSAWSGRDLYAYSDVLPGVLLPEPGVNGFSLVMWLHATIYDTNPATTFTDYRIIQANDDDVDGTAAANTAWYVDNGEGAFSGNAIGFAVTDQTRVNMAGANGWNMYAWTIDCAGGAAPIKAYRNGVLQATSAGNVTALNSMAGFRYPVVALGAHQAGISKTLIPGAGQEIGPVALFTKNLTAAELLAAYGVMTA